jgi:Cu/Ag efflux pump CusA
MLETTIMLKPEYIPDGRWSVKRNPAWRDGMTVEKLKAELTEKMKQVPGYVPAFLQPIENRILMLYTGIRAQVGVKIYGDNLDKIQRKAFEIEKLINSIEGAAGVSPSRVQGKPILALQGIEGKMFKPMALVVMLALGGSLVLAVTLMPVLCSYLLGGKIQEKDNWLVTFTKRLYTPLLQFGLRFKPAHRAAHARDVWLLAVGLHTHRLRVHPAARRGRLLLPVHPQQQRRAFLLA